MMKQSDNPYGFIYKTILPDNRYYIGQHKIISNNTLDPTYFGSGVIIRDYLKSKGKIGLRREILDYGFSYDEMNSLEGQHVTEEILNDPLNINLDKGGRNKFTRYKDVKKRIGKGISRARSENPENWPTRTGSDNNKSIKWKLISPDGTEYIFYGGLGKFCKTQSISGNTMSKAYREGWIPKRGTCAGWKLFDLTSEKGTHRDTLNHGETHSGLNNPHNKGKKNGKR